MHLKDYSTNLTCMHPNQSGLVWREKDKCLFKSCMIIPYTDEINWESLFSTTVYRKPIFTGEYTRCNSVYSKKRKINLIFTHVNRANCSQSNLQVKRTKIRSIFQNNDCCLDKRVSFIHAYELMLCLHVFCQTGPPRRVDCLASPSVCHMKTEASR